MNRDLVRTAYQELHRAASDKSLTTALLSRAVRMTYDDGGDNIEASVGVNWLRHQPDEVAKHGIDWPSFIRDHQDVHEFMYLTISCERFFSLLPAEERLEHLKRVLDQRDPLTHTKWIGVAQKAGIARQDLAQIIRRYIEATPLRPGETHSPLDNFVTYGHGNSWNLFDPAELVTMLKLCAEKAARGTLKILSARYRNRQGISPLKPEEIRSICRLAAKQMTKFLHQESAPLLAVLDTDDLLDLCQRIEKIEYDSDHRTAAEIVVHLVLTEELSDSARSARWHSLSALIDKISTPALFQAAIKALPDQEVPVWLKHELLAHADKKGYELGVIEKDGYLNKKLKKRVEQYQVSIGGHIFIRNDAAYIRDAYYPRLGDRVLFQTTGEKRTPQVTAVIFYLVRPRDWEPKKK